MKNFLNIPNAYVTIHPEHKYTFIRANVNDVSLRTFKILGKGVYRKNNNALMYKTYDNVIILLELDK